MAKTTSSIVGVNTFYNKVMRRVLNEHLRIVPLGQEQPLPKGAGKTMEWFEWNKIPVTLTAGVVDAKVAVEGVDPTDKALTSMKRQASLVEYMDFSTLTRLLKATHIDREVKGVVKLYAAYAAEVIDLVTQQELVSKGCLPVRADLDSTFTYSGSFTTVTSTTSMADTGLATNTNFGDANDDLNMGVLTITSGTQKGTGCVVTDYVTVGGVMTLGAGIEAVPATGDTFTVTSPAALSSATASNADSLNTSAIERGIRLLDTYDAQKDSNDFYMGVLSPEVAESLKKDSKWVDVAKYSADVARTEGKGGFFRSEIGRWGGVRWISTTKPFKFPTQADPAVAGTTKGPGASGANYDASAYAVGAGITVSYIFGKNAFGTVKFDGFGGKGSAPKIIVKTPNEHDTSNPGNMRSTVAFYAAYAAKTLQPLNMAQIWSAEKQI